MYIDKNVTPPTIPGTYLDIFDGLVVMISACQDSYLNKRGRPGFDSPSERHPLFASFVCLTTPKVEFLYVVLLGLQAYYSVKDVERSEKGLKGGNSSAMCMTCFHRPRPFPFL